MRACGALVCGGRRRLGTSFHRDSFTAIPSQRRARESLARLCEGVPLKGVARSHRLHPRWHTHQWLLARRLHVGDMLDALAQLWRGAMRRRAKWALLRPLGASFLARVGSRVRADLAPWLRRVVRCTTAFAVSARSDGPFDFRSVSDWWLGLRSTSRVL